MGRARGIAVGSYDRYMVIQHAAGIRHTALTVVWMRTAMKL